MPVSLRMHSRAVLVATALTVSMAPAWSSAQSNAGGATNPGSWDAGQLFATRAQLESILARFETETGAYSEEVRTIAEGEAELIRTRLRDGDFEVGDQIQLTVTGQTALTGQFTVAAGRVLVLPIIGGMPLRGLLRAELPDSVQAFIARFIRDPQVYVQTSMRLQIFGKVANPGYHQVAADARLPDVLAAVGQPTQDARIERMRVRRGGETIWDGESLQLAIVEGRTLDQLSLRAGDVIDVPGASTFRIGSVLQSLYYVVPLTLLISRIF